MTKPRVGGNAVAVTTRSPYRSGMGIDADDMDWHAALAALHWQADLGVTDAVADHPINRFALTDTAPAAVRAATITEAAPPAVADPVAQATALAAGAATLAELAAAMAAFEGCELKRGARNFVFGDGNPAARVMIVGEAPGQEEDREGRPFVGRAGQLLDRMFAAVGLSRTSPDVDQALYITNVLPWRPPQNRTPTAPEIAMFRPFLDRHIQLVDPAVLIVMGNVPLQALLNTQGITRMRGTWADWQGRPVMPMTHPAYLLRNPVAKREAWADLLAVDARLDARHPARPQV
jgi:uracil-DNA glycosylase